MNEASTLTQISMVFVGVSFGELERIEHLKTTSLVLFGGYLVVNRFQFRLNIYTK